MFRILKPRSLEHPWVWDLLSLILEAGQTKYQQGSKGPQFPSATQRASQRQTGNSNLRLSNYY